MIIIILIYFYISTLQPCCLVAVTLPPAVAAYTPYVQVCRHHLMTRQALVARGAWAWTTPTVRSGEQTDDHT